jgi:hypothetical protein
LFQSVADSPSLPFCKRLAFSASRFATAWFCNGAVAGFFRKGMAAERGLRRPGVFG